VGFQSVALSLVTALSAGALWRRRGRPTHASARRIRAWRPVLPVLLAALVLVQAGYLVNHVMVSPDAEITTNWGTPDQYAAVGARLPRLVGHHPVLMAAEQGTLSYYCDCEDADNIFSDPATMAQEIRSAQHRDGGVLRWLLGVNFHFRDLGARPLPYSFVLVYTKVKPPPGNIFWRLTSPSVGVGYDFLAPAH